MMKSLRWQEKCFSFQGCNFTGLKTKRGNFEAHKIKIFSLSRKSLERMIQFSGLRVSSFYRKAQYLVRAKLLWFRLKAIIIFGYPQKFAMYKTNHPLKESMGLMNCWRNGWNGLPRYVVVRYLKDLAPYFISEVHVSKLYPINYIPLNFRGTGKISDTILPSFLETLLIRPPTSLLIVNSTGPTLPISVMINGTLKAPII